MARTSIRQLDPASLSERLCTSVEGRALAAGHPNVLVRGTRHECDRIVAALRSCFRQPIHTSLQSWRPPVASGGGTFIMYDLETLASADQRELLSWLNEEAARVQMVGVTSAALFPLVEGAGFLDALYYRLNTLYIDADDIW